MLEHRPDGSALTDLHHVRCTSKWLAHHPRVFAKPSGMPRSPSAADSCEVPIASVHASHWTCRRRGRSTAFSQRRCRLMVILALSWIYAVTYADSRLPACGTSWTQPCTILWTKRDRRTYEASYTYSKPCRNHLNAGLVNCKSLELHFARNLKHSSAFRNKLVANRLTGASRKVQLQICDTSSKVGPFAAHDIMKKLHGQGLLISCSLIRMMTFVRRKIGLGAGGLYMEIYALYFVLGVVFICPSYKSASTT